MGAPVYNTISNAAYTHRVHTSTRLLKCMWSAFNFSYFSPIPCINIDVTGESKFKIRLERTGWALLDEGTENVRVRGSFNGGTTVIDNRISLFQINNNRFSL